jgi:two-component system nitrate/nitrite response regulator NarL
MQCPGHRDNGEHFMADVWFSTYKEGANPKLAAIIAEISRAEISDDNSPGSNLLPGADHNHIALNSREIEVLRCVVQGLSNKEIAAQMDISESAVKNTLQQLFATTGVRTRSQLVRVALEDYRNFL